MKRSRPKLIPDKEYFFTHKRKRTFRAVFKRFVRAPANDVQDEYYYECEVEASQSENPWSRLNEEERISILVRPSLVTLIQSAPAGAAMQHPVVPRVQQPAPPQTKDGWVSECIHTIRSVFRNRRRA